MYKWMKGIVELSNSLNSWINGLTMPLYISLYTLKVKSPPPPTPNMTPFPKMTPPPNILNYLIDGIRGLMDFLCLSLY